MTIQYTKQTVDLNSVRLLYRLTSPRKIYYLTHTSNSIHNLAQTTYPQGRQLPPAFAPIRVIPDQQSKRPVSIDFPYIFSTSIGEKAEVGGPVGRSSGPSCGCRSTYGSDSRSSSVRSGGIIS